MDKIKDKPVNVHKNDVSEDGYHTKVGDSHEPKAKLARLSTKSTPSSVSNLNMLLNSDYMTKDFTELLSKRWAAEQNNDFKHVVTGAEVYRDPFQICLLPNLFSAKEICKQLVDEMVEKVQWSPKQMDLYQFFQSTDLSNMTHCKMLTNFLQLLRRNVCPWLEKVTNLKLDYVSASCSMYTAGDYLLVHDDLLKDRQIAFVYYLSPWQAVEQWNEQQGGCLEIFEADEQGFPQFPVRRKISPKNNQFVFFKVGSRSFHQVGEVTTFDYPRLTINGWFHGASNDDLMANISKPFSSLEFKQPQETENLLELLLNAVYLKSNTRKSIQKRVEDNSEICLYEFFRREIFEQALAQLKEDSSLKWRRQGPANAHNYEVLELSSASKTVAQLASLFTGIEMFSLLRDYTDLDLAGSNAFTPGCSFEFQRWSHGSYTVLGDGAICDENTLDLTYYLNAADGAGIITYLSPEAEEPMPSEAGRSYDENDDDSVLLTITPIDNSLNIVYRCEGTTKFTKYVSHNTPLEKGPVFVISCSYKE